MRLMKLIALLPLFFASFNANAASSVLRVTCDGDAAGAVVYINGKLKGECPFDIKVPEGKLRLRAEKGGDEDHEPRMFEQEIYMGGGIAKKIELRFGEGELTAAGKRRKEDEMRRQAEEEQRQRETDKAACLKKYHEKLTGVKRKYVRARQACLENRHPGNTSCDRGFLQAMSDAEDDYRTATSENPCKLSIEEENEFLKRNNFWEDY